MIGSVYLLHFEPGLLVTGNRYARHYLGWTLDPERRIAEHLRGAGSPLVAAAVGAGQTIETARIWPDVDRFFERRIKNRHELPRFCPLCAERGLCARSLLEAA